jgi:hypothetical protein
MKVKKSPTTPQQTTPEVRVVLETAEKKHGLSLKGMVVAIVAILASGTVAAAAIYGVATDDYSGLKAIYDLGCQALAKFLVLPK